MKWIFYWNYVKSRLKWLIKCQLDLSWWNLNSSPVRCNCSLIQSHVQGHTHTHIQIHIHTDTYRHIHTYTHIHPHTYTHIHTTTQTHRNALWHRQCAMTKNFQPFRILTTLIFHLNEVMTIQFECKIYHIHCVIMLNGITNETLILIALCSWCVFGMDCYLCEREYVSIWTCVGVW